MSVQLRICGSWWLCLIAVVVMGVLLFLGSWQLERAHEKRDVLMRHKSMQQAEILSELPEFLDVDALRHRAVRLKGVPDGHHQFLLDNQIRNGKPGYNVLTPFRLSSGDWALVDRGWVELGLSRQLLPDVTIQDDVSVVEGHFYAPYSEAYALGNFDQGGAGWPLVIQFLDFDGMGERLGVELLPLTVRMSPDSGPGYLREWAVISMGPEKHLGYAVQWFAMAAAFLALLWLANRKRTET